MTHPTRAADTLIHLAMRRLPGLTTPGLISAKATGGARKTIRRSGQTLRPLCMCSWVPRRPGQAIGLPLPCAKRMASASIEVDSAGSIAWPCRGSLSALSALGGCWHWMLQTRSYSKARKALSAVPKAPTVISSTWIWPQASDLCLSSKERPPSPLTVEGIIPGPGRRKR